jgi:hypothetical protein
MCRNAIKPSRMRTKARSREPVAWPARVEGRAFTFQVGQITESKHHLLIRSGSLSTAYGRPNNPATGNWLAMRCLSFSLSPLTALRISTVTVLEPTGDTWLMATFTVAFFPLLVG